MLLLVGGDFEIGAATARHLALRNVAHKATTRRTGAAHANQIFLDLTHPLDRWEPPAETRAACIFAAVGRLTACAADPAGSSFINVTQTLALVDRLQNRGIHTLYLSTNQVFDGSTPNVLPQTAHSPVSEYGHQKARTETELLRRMEAGAPIAILRLAKVVSPHMALLKGWLEALVAGRPVSAFQDMPMAATPTQLAVELIAALVRERPLGVFQLTGPRDVTYFEVARYLAQKVGADSSLVRSVGAASAGMPPGATPRHTTLDSQLVQQRFGLTVPDIWDVLDDIVAAFQGQSGPVGQRARIAP